jgi:allatostatin receptor
LATADLLFIVTCIPPTAIDYAMGWPLDDQWCKIVQYLINVTTYMSVYTLVLLSLDRYLVKI